MIQTHIALHQTGTFKRRSIDWATAPRQVSSVEKCRLLTHHLNLRSGRSKRKRSSQLFFVLILCILYSSDKRKRFSSWGLYFFFTHTHTHTHTQVQLRTPTPTPTLTPIHTYPHAHAHVHTATYTHTLFLSFSRAWGVPQRTLEQKYGDDEECFFPRTGKVFLRQWVGGPPEEKELKRKKNGSGMDEAKGF